MGTPNVFCCQSLKDNNLPNSEWHLIHLLHVIMLNGRNDNPAISYSFAL